MKLSIIRDWINGNISSEKLKTIIDPYVSEFQKKLRIKGTSLGVAFTLRRVNSKAQALQNIV